MIAVDKTTGEPVNGDNTAADAAADQLDAEGSIVHSYERLKKSRGGFLAHWTRLYNEVEPLMADFENHQRVKDLSAAIDEQLKNSEQHTWRVWLHRLTKPKRRLSEPLLAHSGRMVPGWKELK